MAEPIALPQVAAERPWWREVTWYHWAVLLLAAGGWLFDCMGQRIFVLARQPAMRQLLGADATDDKVLLWGTAATMILMVGWGTGGIIFGMMSDKYGRVKAMVATLVAYTVFAGLSGVARNGTEFLIYRFLCGLGVGGMFGSATTLLAESVTPRFRTFALGIMQSLSAIGNILASGVATGIALGQENFWGRWSGWQVLFFVGVIPIVLVVPIVAILREPEVWKKAKADAARGAGKKVGRISDLFRDPRWRKSTIIGICFGIAGMVGLWGIGFFTPELISTAFRNRPLQAGEVVNSAALLAALKTPANPAVTHLKQQLSPQVQGLVDQAQPGQDVPVATQDALRDDLNRLIQRDTPLYDAAVFQSLTLKKGTANLVKLVEDKKATKENVVFLNRQLVEQAFPGTITELEKSINWYKTFGTLLQDVGAMLGMLTFTYVASRFNRRTAFLLAFSSGLIVVAFVFHSLKTETDVYWMLPMVGFVTLSSFAGYSIYFPEIFPTRLRGTGVGFCYNTVRYAAAPFPLLLGWLSTMLPFRTVAMVMCLIYLVGIVALIWAPETKGRPLPED
jgi:MFS family permease